MHPQVLVVLPCFHAQISPTWPNHKGGFKVQKATDVLQHLHGFPCWISDLLWSSATGNLSLASLNETTLGTLGVLRKIWRIQVKCPENFPAAPKKIQENKVPTKHWLIILVGFYLWLSISPFQGWSISSHGHPKPKKLRKLRPVAAGILDTKVSHCFFSYLNIHGNEDKVGI